MSKFNDEALRLATEHYENFPVTGLFIPKNLRPAVAIIYAFARQADDIADEGNSPAATRLAKLQALEDQLQQQQNCSELTTAVLQLCAEHQLPLALFLDLLSAFQQDISKSRYRNEAERLSYCARSAHPIGRLILHLFKQATPQTLLYSDAICTALQLLNFLQDIHSDYQQRDRLYLTSDDLSSYALKEADLFNKEKYSKVRCLMELEIRRCNILLQKGKPLVHHLKGRLKWQVAAIIACGFLVCRRLRQRGDKLQNPCHLHLRHLPAGLWLFAKILCKRQPLPL